jgi:hypothetical protein
MKEEGAYFGKSPLGILIVGWGKMIYKIRRIIAVMIASCVIVITIGRCVVNATGISMFSDESLSNGTVITSNIDDPKMWIWGNM